MIYVAEKGGPSWQLMRRTGRGEWNQMMDEGLLDRPRVWLRWAVFGDDRLDEFWAPMESHVQCRPSWHASAQRVAGG